jgi:hypothetical protein
MKVVLLYRHADGRLVEVSGDASSSEVWQIYPTRELLKKLTSGGVDGAKEHIPEGFAPDAASFSPPCPKCDTPSAMCLRTGMYQCPECSASF